MHATNADRLAILIQRRRSSSRSFWSSIFALINVKYIGKGLYQLWKGIFSRAEDPTVVLHATESRGVTKSAAHAGHIPSVLRPGRVPPTVISLREVVM